MGRLRGELSSLGFSVSVATSTEEDAQAAAAITLVEDAALPAVDVWIVDSEKRVQHVARVTAEGSAENAIKRVAIRASEVLRARLIEGDLRTTGKELGHREPVSPTPAVMQASNETSPAPRRVGLELGIAAVMSLDRIGPALVPIITLNHAVAGHLLLQATFAGLGTRPNVSTAAGTASVSTEFGLLGASYRFGHDRIRPLCSLSLGALRTSVTGQTEAPREGHSVGQWSFLLDASLGAAFELSRQYSVALAGHAQMADPSVVVRFGDQKVASAGRPNLLLTLTLGIWP